MYVCMYICIYVYVCMYWFVILQIAASKDVVLKRFTTDDCSAKFSVTCS